MPILFIDATKKAQLKFFYICRVKCGKKHFIYKIGLKNFGNPQKRAGELPVPDPEHATCRISLYFLMIYM
jgi:hypothetical protein